MVAAMVQAYRDELYVFIDRPCGFGNSHWKLTLNEAAQLFAELKRVFDAQPIYEDEERE